MKYSIDAFEQLQDFASYVGKGYLNSTLSPTALDQITYLNGAFCFLLDRSLFNEKAGPDLTEEVESSIQVQYEPKKLSDIALMLSEESKDNKFLSDKGSFSKYYEFIIETERYIECASNDEYGLLTLVYLKALSSIIEIDTKPTGIDPLKINEVVFLNGTYSVMLIIKGFLGKAFTSLESFPFFDEVSTHAERIRREILD